MILDPIKSIVNFPFYREVTQRTVGRAIAYVVYMCFLCSVAVAVYLYIYLTPVMREMTDWAATSIPALTLTNGKLASSLTAPLVLRYPKSDQIAIAIDTNRTTPVTVQEMTEQKLIFFAAQNTLYVMTQPNRMELVDLAQARNPKPLTIDARFFRSISTTLPWIILPAAWLTLWVFMIVWKLAASLSYSLIGIAINAASGTELTYDSLFKIAVYAQTPVVLIEISSMFVPTHLPVKGSTVLALLIVGVYTWQAIRQHHSPETA